VGLSYDVKLSDFSRRKFLLSMGVAAALPRLSLARNPILPVAHKIQAADRLFLEDYEKRCCLYFLEQAGAHTGLALDRADMDGRSHRSDVASIAATGFGLTALCIAAEHGWLPKDQARARVATTLRYFWSHAFHDHGWFYHFVNVNTGVRQGNSEISSIDTTLLLCGILAAQGYFFGDREIQSLGKQIYERVDFAWMLNGDPHILSHGVMPGKGFLKARWEEYSEASVLYLLAIGSPKHPIPALSWYSWVRPEVQYQSWEFISGGPLFTHQYSHAWVDFRHQRDGNPSYIDYFQNSQIATYAHRDFCVSLQSTYDDYNADMWGITASDSPAGYVAWGGPPEAGPINGTLVPCAAAGSLMFAPEICLPVLQQMNKVYGEKIYGRYGFTDAFNPNWKDKKLWVNQDVIGIDVGISLLSIENLLTGNSWRWFMRNPYVLAAMDRVGFQISTPGIAVRTVRTGAQHV
jgi:hypothetical protein